MFLARIFLLLAISAEVAGTSTMKLIGVHGSLWGYVVMYALISVSYYFLSLAAKKIAIGVAYAVWEGLGIALITLVSLFLFDADLNAQELIGLAMAVVGIVMVTSGEQHSTPADKTSISTTVRCES
ncbi:MULTISPECIES: SMR family transporter [unclassified Vibrio]|uniref:SMR family transporter n=1 Tax=unclassified Vibrio TaxID=2614977 RepID=UPI001360FB3B|nr:MULTISPECIES: SMR family transporter [unclassified Vibrio]NAW57452.1 QacE family quaternary ammonium compound efflux SMR transporter [Vibrio sp. V36_P2S2PM302]NAX23713.1 QacE family quaternary ammonium compound efflux SMR transporter [Vibrio sp. V39_P1S14PM300]NAX27139.1 QacE family quaternary ammonium compound efflux SMR transporter [Vibrio sp. V38_P2S17PM301]NAX30304.1 QacE family quaternary ammonium compound efflux SMR transporter [Vibrio sp. V37_P2S8PM304]